MEPMAEGGQWLAMGGSGTPHYVVNPDHIARLQREGYQIIADPRIPEKDEVEDDDTTRRITTAKTAHKSGSRRMDTASG